MVPGILVFKGFAKAVFSCFLHFFDCGSNHETWTFRNEKTRVVFGRTEVSVRLDCIFFATFRLDMVPGVLVFKDFGIVYFHDCCVPVKQVAQN